MFNIAYFANPESIHDCKWINYFINKNNYNVIIICKKSLNQESSLLKPNSKTIIYPILPETYPGPINKQNRIIKKEIRDILIKHNISLVHSMYAFHYAFWVSQLDIVHIITTRGSDVLLSLIKLFSGKKSFSIKDAIIRIFEKRLVRKSFHHARIITCTSGLQKATLHKHLHIPTYNIFIIPTGVDKTIFLPEEKKNNDVIRIFSPRSMKEIYNIHVIIKAYAIFKNIIRQKSELIIIDDFPNTEYSGKIRQIIKNEGISDSVVIKEKISQKQMAELYRSSKMSIMIPLSDGTPNTAIESMLCKCPLIIADLPYDPILINIDTSWIIQRVEVQDLANKMIDLSYMPLSAIEKKVNHAYQTVSQNYSLDTVLERVDKIYNSLLTTS